MIPEPLQRVLKEVCAGAPADVLRSIADTGSFVLGGVAFTVAAGGEVDAEGVYVFCDFGPVPTTNTVAVLKRLLELNLYLSLPFAPRLALNSETGHVLLIHREVQGQIEAPRLAAALDGMVKQAHAWRETRFLEPQPTGPARPPAPTQPATRPTPSRTSPVRAGGR